MRLSVKSDSRPRLADPSATRPAFWRVVAGGEYSLASGLSATLPRSSARATRRHRVAHPSPADEAPGRAGRPPTGHRRDGHACEGVATTGDVRAAGRGVAEESSTGSQAGFGTTA